MEEYSERSRVSPAALALLGSLVVAIGFFLLVPMRFAPPRLPYKTACLSNLKQTAIASIMYQADWDDKFGPVSHWIEDYITYTKGTTIFHSVDGGAISKNPLSYGFAHNSQLDFANADILPNPQAVPLIYDSSNLQRDASDPVTSLPASGRHLTKGPGKGQNHVAYVDGHTKTFDAGAKP